MSVQGILNSPSSECMDGKGMASMQGHRRHRSVLSVRVSELGRQPRLLVSLPLLEPTPTNSTEYNLFKQNLLGSRKYGASGD